MRARVSHRCADGWQAPCLLEDLRCGIIDILVLAAVPHRRCDRRALEEALLEGAVTAVRVVAVRDRTPERAPVPVAASPRVQVG